MTMKLTVSIAMFCCAALIECCEPTSLMLSDVLKTASEATIWRVNVDFQKKGPKYEITDTKIIRELSELLLADRELVREDSALALTPYVYVDLVNGKDKMSVTKVEFGGDVFYVTQDKIRYTVQLKSSDLYQRLVDRNFEFPEKPK